MPISRKDKFLHTFLKAIINADEIYSVIDVSEVNCGFAIVFDRESGYDFARNRENFTFCIIDVLRRIIYNKLTLITTRVNVEREFFRTYDSGMLRADTKVN